MNKVLFLTRNCNLNCTYCYQKDNKGNSETNMTIETVDSILKGVKKERVALFGGEPFLNKKVLKHLIEKYDGLKFKITTNVSAIDFDILEGFFKKNMFSTIRMSIDPIGSFNRYNKQVEEKVWDNFYKVLKLVKHYKQKINLGVTIVYGEKDFSKLFSMYKKIKDISLEHGVYIKISVLWENNLIMNEENTKVLFEKEFAKIIEYDKSTFYGVEFGIFKQRDYHFCDGRHLDSYDYDGKHYNCYHTLFEEKPEDSIDEEECKKCKNEYCSPCAYRSKKNCFFYRRLKIFLEEVLN